MLTYLMWGPTLNENDTLSYLTDLGILYNTKNMRTRFSIEHRYNPNQISDLSIILQINTDFSSNHDIEFKTKYDQYSYINEISINYFF